MIDGEANESGSTVDQGQGKADVEPTPVPAEKPEEKIDFKAELDKMKAENEELRTLTKNATKQAHDSETFVNVLTEKLSQVANRREVPNDGVDPRERLRERISDDPASVLDEHYQARTGPLVQRFLEQQGQTNRQLFITKMGMSEEGKEALKDYLEDVDNFLKDFGPEHRASADAYDAALRWVLSKPDNFNKEVERRIKKEREKEKVHFVEPGSGGERVAREQKRELSALEQEVAKGLGLSEEDYVKYKEG